MANKREETYGKIKAGLPFVNRDKLLDEWWKIPEYHLLKKYKDRLTIPQEKRWNNLAMDVSGSLLDALVGKLEEELSLDMYAIFPKGRIWSEYEKGASTIEKMVTVEHNGFWVPVFLNSDKNAGIDSKALAEGIKYVVENEQSPYNSDRSTRRAEDKKLKQFIRGEFTRVAAEKYTRGDFGVLEQPFQFEEWFVRDDTWAISQFWDMKEKTVTVSGNVYKVHEFTRPKGFDWEMFLYWAGGDKVYDLIDSGWDPIQKRVEKLFSGAGQQRIIEEEYKLISTVRRSLSRRRTPLTYDLRGKKPGIASADNVLVNVN